MITDDNLAELDEAMTKYIKKSSCEESALKMALDELDHIKREDLTEVDIKALWSHL